MGDHKRGDQMGPIGPRETLRERTWRERQVAKAAVVEAVRRIQAQERALDEARGAYREALKQQDEAVQRDIDAWAT